MKKILLWLQENWPIIAYPILFLLCGIFWLLLWSENAINPLLPATVVLFSTFVLGLLSFPAIQFYLWLSSMPAWTLERNSVMVIPSATEQIGAFFILCIGTMLLGMFIWSLFRVKRIRRWLKILVYANVIFGLGCGTLYSSGSLGQIPPLRSTPSQSCEFNSDAAVVIRAQYYDNIRDVDRGLAGIPTLQQTVYSWSNDSGETWRQFMRTYSWSTNCKGIQIVDSNRFYVLRNGILVYTDNGAESWHMLDFRQLNTVSTVNWDEMIDKQDIQVHFTDELNGEMTVNYAYYDPLFVLITSDGGANWQVRDS